MYVPHYGNYFIINVIYVITLYTISYEFIYMHEKEEIMTNIFSSGPNFFCFTPKGRKER